MLKSRNCDNEIDELKETEKLFACSQQDYVDFMRNYAKNDSHAIWIDEDDNIEKRVENAMKNLKNDERLHVYYQKKKGKATLLREFLDSIHPSFDDKLFVD